MPMHTAAPLIPPRPTLNKLRDAAAECKACDLWKTGTQTVFGEGRPKAVISAAFGFLWMRRLPRGSHLKCFTTFVT